MYSDEVWMMIREMKEKGMSVTAIAEQLGIDRKTVRKYMNISLPSLLYPEYFPSLRYFPGKVSLIELVLCRITN